MEGGLPAQINEVVWECGPGLDCTMCEACSSLGEDLEPQDHWRDYLCLWLCMHLECVCVCRDLRALEVCL